MTPKTFLDTFLVSMFAIGIVLIFLSGCASRNDGWKQNEVNWVIQNV